MPNIKFSYLYRDGANYKNFKALIFGNPDNIDLTKIEQLIRSKLIDGIWFYDNEWKLPDLHFKFWDDEIDHTWHEFESVTYTDEPQNVPLEIGQLLAEIEKTHWYAKIYKKHN